MRTLDNNSKTYYGVPIGINGYNAKELRRRLIASASALVLLQNFPEGARKLYTTIFTPITKEKS